MPVDAGLSGAVPAGAVVADEVGVVVAGCLYADGVFELADEGEGGEEARAGGVAAGYALGSDVRDGSCEAFEGGGVLAGAAGESEAGTVFEADAVWDLGFEGGYLCCLVRG